MRVHGLDVLNRTLSLEPRHVQTWHERCFFVQKIEAENVEATSSIAVYDSDVGDGEAGAHSTDDCDTSLAVFCLVRKSKTTKKERQT